LNFNDICYWKQDEQVLEDIYRPENILPSDSWFREDLILYKMGLNDKAQDAKIFLEEKQRHDMALMKSAKEKK
jgi:hypothetical protein